MGQAIERLAAALSGTSTGSALDDLTVALSGHDLIFYENRSTPEVVAKGASGKPKKGYGKQTRRRAATSEEEKKISKGDWVQVDQSGNKSGDDGYKKTKYRPGLLKK